MSQPNFSSEEPLLRRANESLASTEVPPGPSPELLRRVKDQMPESGPVVSVNGSHRRRLRPYYAAAAVVVLGAIGFATLLPEQGNRVLADVVKQLADVNTVKARLTKTVDGVKVESTKLFFKGESLRRMEFSSGDIDVVNPRLGNHTRLMATEKKAIVSSADAVPADSDQFSELRRIASQPLNPIEARTVDGTSHALGFSQEESGRTETIWVDPKTRLPIRAESRFNDTDGRMVNLTLDELEYNIELQDSLFEISVPENYTLIDRRAGKTVDDLTATILALEERAREIRNDPAQSDFYDKLRKEIEDMKQKQSESSASD